jgi:hypothetical protein
MTKIVILAIAAAWAAVLLPPMLRARLENRPGSSVTDFRRQLSTLQRTVPTRSMSPMRSMARPLAPAPTQRTARAPQGYRTHGDASTEIDRGSADHRPVRRHPARRVSRREVIRRRRTNVLFILAATTVLTLFLAATTQSSVMLYTFAFAFVALCGYCYKLAQIRQYEQDAARYPDRQWYTA